LASIFEASGAFHLRTYSSVNISTGEPLTEIGPTGKIIRKQQSVMLVRKDDRLHKTKTSTAVLLLANAKVAEIERWEASIGTPDERKPDGNMTVADFYEQKFLPHIRAELAPSTVESYESYWNTYLKNHFNHTKTLKNYEAFTATNFLETLAKKYSKNTVMHCRAVASAIFAYAIAKGYLVAATGETKNPWRDARKNIKCQDVEETHAYTVTEIERILDTLERVQGREEYSARLAGMLVTICFYGGLRPSEAAGLRWENVDLNNGSIKVCEVFVAGKFRKTTKTEETRTVPMLPQLLNRMKIWHMTWQHPSNGLVFPNQAGDNPININDVSARIIGPALERVGLDWYGLYACRRGFGTVLVNAGATLEETSVAMGNSPSVVFAHYFKKQNSKLAANGIAKLRASMLGSGEIEMRKFQSPTLELTAGGQ